jgi:hypothetical protein
MSEVPLYMAAVQVVKKVFLSFSGASQRIPQVTSRLIRPTVGP